MELELVDKKDYEDDKAKTAAESESYDGPERRIEQRRVMADRRAMVRFELGKEDRRNMHDRRNSGEIWDKGHTMF